MSMLEEIKKNLNSRMANYTDSRQPTSDEVRLAWLVGEIEGIKNRLELEKVRTIKNSVTINNYPANYVEEEMPQIIVEIRYQKDYDPNDEFRKEEALSLATKVELFINEIL